MNYYDDDFDDFRARALYECPWLDDDEPLIPQRRCSCCQRWYPATREYFHSNGRTGLRSACKDCISARHAADYQRRKFRRNGANFSPIPQSDGTIHIQYTQNAHRTRYGNP